MPPRYPKADNRFLAWARAITRVWTGWQPGGGSTGVPDIGLSEAQAQRAADLFEAALAAHRHQEAMRQAALAASEAKRLAFKRFKAELGGDISTIQAYAKATGDPGVFVRARLRARKRAMRRGPIAPHSPNLRFVVSQGEMVLTWKGRTLPGTFYRVERRLTPADAPDAPYRFIAAVGERRFVDTTIPPGTTRVEYLVTATKNGRTAYGFLTGATLHGERPTGHAQRARRGGRAA